MLFILKTLPKEFRSFSKLFQSTSKNHSVPGCSIGFSVSISCLLILLAMFILVDWLSCSRLEKWVLRDQ